LIRTRGQTTNKENPLFNEIKFNISLKVSTIVFGTFIYRHMNLRKPKNPIRRPKPKYKLIYKRKPKNIEHN